MTEVLQTFPQGVSTCSADPSQIRPARNWLSNLLLTSGLVVASVVIGTNGQQAVPSQVDDSPRLLAPGTHGQLLPGTQASSTEARIAIGALRHAGFTVEQIASAMGVTRRSIHSWQRDGRVRADHLERIVRLAASVATGTGPTTSMSGTEIQRWLSSTERIAERAAALDRGPVAGTRPDRLFERRSRAARHIVPFNEDDDRSNAIASYPSQHFGRLLAVVPISS